MASFHVHSLEVRPTEEHMSLTLYRSVTEKHAGMVRVCLLALAHFAKSIAVLGSTLTEVCSE